MYIINLVEIAYHQNEVLYIIKSQRNTPSVMIYTLKRDDIRLAAMIYQVCDLDKKILQKMYPFLQYFLAEVKGFEPLWAVNPNGFQDRLVMTASIHLRI